MGASLAFRQIFGDEHPDVRHVEHSALFLEWGRLVGQVAATLWAGVERQIHAEVGVFACLEGLTGMVTAFAFGVFSTQRFVAVGAIQAVAAWWLAAVRAVLVEAGF